LVCLASLRKTVAAKYNYLILSRESTNKSMSIVCSGHIIVDNYPTKPCLLIKACTSKYTSYPRDLVKLTKGCGKYPDNKHT
jgi:hypothetical protein